MAIGKTLDSLIADCEVLIQVWSDNPTFSMGEQTLEKTKTDLELLKQLRKLRDEMRVDLAKLVDETSDQMKLIESIVVRGRSGMKSTYGADSTQYGQVGGTRQSERKSRSRTKSNTPPAAG